MKLVRMGMYRIFATVVLASVVSFGCGDDDAPGNSIENSEDRGNDAGTNDAGIHDSGTDRGGNDGGATDDSGANDGGTHDGGTSLVDLVTFVAPGGDPIYTNGALFVEIAVSPRATQVELVRDEVEVLVGFDGTTTYDWDTTTVDEGNYDLALRYDVEGSLVWAADGRLASNSELSPQRLTSTRVH